MDVFFWAIDPRVAFWTRFKANFRLGGNQGPLFLNGLTSPRVPGQLRTKINKNRSREEVLRDATAPRPVTVAHSVIRLDAGFLEDVLDGLGQAEKTLPAKYFYDKRGSRL